MRHALRVVRRLLGAKLQPQAELLQGEHSIHQGLGSCCLADTCLGMKGPMWGCMRGIVTPCSCCNSPRVGATLTVSFELIFHSAVRGFLVLKQSVVARPAHTLCRCCCLPVHVQVLLFHPVLNVTSHLKWAQDSGFLVRACLCRCHVRVQA
jgi:hypothetical protein